MALDKVVYGDDNREDVINFPDKLFRTLARSTAAQILAWDLEHYDDNYFQLTNNTMQRGQGVCANQRFS